MTGGIVNVYTAKKHVSVKKKSNGLFVLVAYTLKYPFPHTYRDSCYFNFVWKKRERSVRPRKIVINCTLRKSGLISGNCRS